MKSEKTIDRTELKLYRQQHAADLLEIILIVHKRLIEIEDCNFLGFCLLTMQLQSDGLITEYQEKLFDDYVDLFWTGKHGMYVWPESEKQPRFIWLEEQHTILQQFIKQQ